MHPSGESPTARFNQEIFMSRQSFLHTLALVDPNQASDLQKEVLSKAQKQAGMLPNMYRAMVNAPALLNTYLDGYAQFRAESGLTPAEQEVVFLAVSQVNQCEYCLAAHSMIAAKRSGVPDNVLDAIRSRQPIPDGRLAALYALVTDTVRTRGEPSAELLRAFLESGYTEKTYLYVVLAIAVKTLSNYTNHAFNTPLDEVFAAYRVEG